MVEIENSKFKKAIIGAYSNLENNKQIVNNLNVFPVPDGDTGTNMALTVKSAVEEVNKINGGTTELSSACSNGALMGARGNSGVILSQLFRGFAKGLQNKEDITPEVFALAIKEASTMAYRAVMKPTEGTILTVARMMSEFAMDNFQKYEELVLFMEDILKAGEIALDKTPDMLPVLKEAGVVDAGGKGLLCLFEGALKILKGEEVVAIYEDKQDEIINPVTMNIEDITFAYCTEFLVRIKKENERYSNAIKGAIKDKLTPLGDSLLVVGDEAIVKIHVHTNVPWVAMKIAAACGELCKIKIENMKEQHSETLVSMEAKKEEKYSKEEVEYVFIGVAAGSGMSKILKDLGVTYVIEGGQTMNPSTQDFMEIIDATNAKNYILMPNNKNIILAATQAKDMSDKNIEVIPTRTIPEAISAMMVFDEGSDLKENSEEMNEAISFVKTGQVTFAVRDTSIKDKVISEGDILGILGSDIVVNGSEIDRVALDLVDSMVDEDSEIISLYFGEDVKESEAKKLALAIEEKYEDLDVELNFGGQPLYYYIVSVE